MNCFHLDRLNCTLSDVARLEVLCPSCHYSSSQRQNCRNSSILTEQNIELHMSDNCVLCGLALVKYRQINVIRRE